MKIKNQKGFSHIEIIIVLVVLVCLAFVGYRIIEYTHKNKSSGTNYAFDIKTVRMSDSNTNANNALNTIENSLSKTFPTVSSFVCSGGINNASADSCPLPPGNTIALSPANIYGPARKVAGYNFYLDPEMPGDNTPPGIEIDTQSKSVTQAVLNDINKEISINNLPTSTTKLTSSAEPSNPDYTPNTTFYAGTSICEIDVGGAGSDDTSNGSDITIVCSPMSDYISQAAQLQPIYKAFVAVHAQFANPSATGDWLEFYPNQDAYFPNDIFNSKTAGYQLAVVTLYEFYNNDSSADSGNNAAWFYAYNNSWYLVNYGSAFTDPLSCSFSFPNSEAHQAFVGTTCAVTLNGSTGTFK